MPTANFSVGRDCQAVLMGPFGRIDLPLVTGFRMGQMPKQVQSDPLDGPPIFADLPGGWDFEFDLDRADATVENLATLVDSTFWTGGIVANATVYVYVQEVDNSTSTFQLNQATLRFDLGQWRSDAVVKQKISGRASTMARI